MKISENEAAYEKLKFYQQICEIRRQVYKLTERFAYTHLKLVSQMRDAARSAKQNIREGYLWGSLAEFRRFLKISQGSLAELAGDIEDCHQDGLFTAEEFLNLSKLAHSASYLMSRYVKSLYVIEDEGTWNVPGKMSESPAHYSIITDSAGTGYNRLQEVTHVTNVIKKTFTQPLVTSVTSVPSATSVTSRNISNLGNL